MNKKSASASSAKMGTAQSKSHSVKETKGTASKNSPREQTVRPRASFLYNNPDWTSPNWSGYARTAAQQGTFYEVSGVWHVPPIATNPTDFNARVTIWVGIDGFTGGNQLIQAGTGAKYVFGAPYYYAWYEVLPDNPAEIPLDAASYPVDAGDTIVAEVANIEGVWSVSIVNTTKNWTFAQNVNYTGPQTSAEFIVERSRNVSTNQYYPLANFGLAIFDLCFINDNYPSFSAAEKGSMVDALGRTIATTSNPDDDNDGFLVAFGSVAPAPPPSSSSGDRRMLRQLIAMLKRKCRVGKKLLQKPRTSKHRTGTTKKRRP